MGHDPDHYEPGMDDEPFAYDRGTPSVYDALQAFRTLQKATVALPWERDTSPNAGGTFRYRRHPFGNIVGHVEPKLAEDGATCYVGYLQLLEPVCGPTGERLSWSTPEEAQAGVDDALRRNGALLLEKDAKGNLTVTDRSLVYDPTYGDDKVCGCGHTYERHFDWSMNYMPGCKYCTCGTFHPATDE